MHTLASQFVILKTGTKKRTKTRVDVAAVVLSQRVPPPQTGWLVRSQQSNQHVTGRGEVFSSGGLPAWTGQGRRGDGECTTRRGGLGIKKNVSDEVVGLLLVEVRTEKLWTCIHFTVEGLGWGSSLALYAALAAGSWDHLLA